MSTRSLKLLIGGEAGDGVFSTADLIAKAFSRAGLHVFTSQIYSSRIRGGHIYTTVRVSDEPLQSQGDHPDFVIGLDLNTVELHGKNVNPGGAVVYDNSAGEVDPEIVGNGNVTFLPVPAKQVAQKELKMPVMKNLVLAGAAFRALEFDPSLEILGTMVEEKFGRKGRGVVEKNLKAAARGKELVSVSLNGAHPLPLMKGADKDLLLLSGSDALSLGAIAAGCRFTASYPITPATDVLEFMVKRLPKLGGACVQAEDELSAVHMIIGASWAGVRSITSTSGPGLSLMVEGLGLASMTETPIVVVDVQRAGPSTGVPTKTEQGDLDLLVYGAHGEAPRIVLAPSDTEECFRMGAEAFNLADRYQCPVFVALDQFLGQAKKTLPGLDINSVRIDRGQMASKNGSKDFRRYEVTDSGVSPRALPGRVEATLNATGLIHDEDGFPRDNPEVRVRMMDKLFRKMEPLREEFPGPQVYGDQKSDTTILAWGSTKGAILEAMEILREDGITLRLLHFSYIWPLPRKKVQEAIGSPRRVICIENNMGGQFAGLLRREIGLDAEKLTRYDGRPFTAEGLRKSLKRRLSE